MRILSAIGLLSVLTSYASAAEYFVGKRGNDTNAGLTKDKAFATIQKGVSTLQPGDTLTIAPGEYHESVKRADLGSLEHDTVIRAELPGTVTLRGDVPAPKFRPLPGHRFVYVADFPFKGQMPAINEIDTLTILKRMPNSSELEFIPGTFFHDGEAGKLYVSTSDMKPVDAHRYSVSVLPTQGIHLIRPKRVTVEGIAVTGFSAMELLHYREETAGGVWGIFVVNGKRCVVRDCKAYLNAWGIGFNSGAKESGDNVIERCTAWGNKSPFANGDMGGLTIFAARRDKIRNSVAYLNGMYGVNIYGTGGAPPGGDDGGNDPKHKSMLENNYAWGNETADIKIKTGYEYHHIAENCVSPGLWSVTNITHGTIGRSAKKAEKTNDIFLNDDPKLDPRAEFADPDNHDYRLQATSRFRGTGIDGADRGAFPYVANVFYVRTDGDDKADGLSVVKGWKTLARAVRDLKPGDTLYVSPGEYEGKLEIEMRGKEGEPITIRGRGTGNAIVKGVVSIKGSEHLSFDRISFHESVLVEQSNSIKFDRCEFVTERAMALASTNVSHLIVSHCAFASLDYTAILLAHNKYVYLSGNIYNNVDAYAVSAIGSTEGLYSDYNSYRNPTKAWDAKITSTLDDLRKTQDQHSVALKPEFDDKLTLKNAASFAGVGPFGKPIGRYRDEPRRSELRLVVKPTIHSVSATTANIEWATSAPATCQLAWGETPACEKSASFNVNCFGTYSLTGLKPGQNYYFRIKSIETPKDILPKTELLSVALKDEPIAFTTLARNAAPVTYYVANDGDDSHSGLGRQDAWQTIRHAATKVNVGDTVLIAGGKYFERIRILATGEAGSPIAFRAMPGERVEINGNGMSLNSGFVAGGKSYLRFDGFYFANFNLFPNDSWSLLNNGEFHLYTGKDIEISRCFSEGRGGYSASPVSAHYIENLTIRNCVNTYKFGGMYFWRCPNLLIENTVFLEPMIMAFVLRNDKTQKATMKNCIFTDMLDKKAKLNIGVLCCDGDMDGFFHKDNCYYLRDCFPVETRNLNGNSPIGKLGKYVHDASFADPLFAGDPGVKGNPKDKSGFSPDRMLELSFPLDFTSFYTTNPDLVKRGIGLQPEAFKDFHFNKKMQ